MRVPGLVTIVAAVALATACGGDGGSGLSREEYERDLRALPDLFGDEGCEPPFPDEALEARREAFAEGVVALEALDPPEEVAEAHAQLLAAHREHEAALGRVLERLRALPDPREAETRDAQAHAIAEGFAEAERAAPVPPGLADAQRAFAEAGFDLQPPPLEPDAYEERTNAVVADVSPIALADAATMADLQAEAERLGRELLVAAGRLEAIVPPPPVAEAHEHLALGLCTRAQELLLFAGFGGVEPDDPAPTAELRQVIATLDPFFEEAAGDYRDRGYDVAVPEVAPAG